MKKDVPEGGDFHAIYREYAPLVRGAVYNICGGADLDDLVQEAFVKIWKGRSGFEGRSALKTWVYRITVNTALDHCRREGKRTGREVGLTADPPSGENAESGAVYRDLVEKGMWLLSPEHRAAVTLMIFEGVTASDAAEIMRVSEGTAKSRLHYARRELGRFLKENGVEP